jgi:hypothetical protein
MMEQHLPKRQRAWAVSHRRRKRESEQDPRSQRKQKKAETDAAEVAHAAIENSKLLLLALKEDRHYIIKRVQKDIQEGWLFPYFPVGWVHPNPSAPTPVYTCSGTLAVGQSAKRDLARNVK